MRQSALDRDAGLSAARTPLVELLKPRVYLLIAVKEVPMRPGPQVDSVKSIQGPPDGVVVDCLGARADVPCSRPFVCLGTCSRTGED